MRFTSKLLGALLLLLSVADRAEILSYTTYYHNDHLGSPVAATDEQGAVLWRAHFRPYGERQENPKDTNFGSVGYTGHAQDADSGMVYMQARYYDPVIGRFMAGDPVGFQLDNPTSFNRYSYGNNNPHKYVDPDGRYGLLALALGGAGVLFYSDYSHTPVHGETVQATPLTDHLGALPGINASKAVKGLGVIGGDKVTKGGVQANKAAGDAFEAQIKSQLQRTDTDVVQQVTIKTQSGVRTRVDLLSKDSTGATRCTECKASATAPLTTNQRLAFPEIQQSGGVVVGKGKPGFPGGTQIPPTKIDIVRP